MGGRQLPRCQIYSARRGVEVGIQECAGKTTKGENVTFDRSTTWEVILNVKHVTTTPNAEETMVYIARVSSPKDEVEKRTDVAKLLNYCIKHGHWSVFEHAHMTVEVHAPRWLTRQLLRHRSFSFSEFSQRYAEVENEFYFSECRMQDAKNRQSSLKSEDDGLNTWWQNAQEEVHENLFDLYYEALQNGIAKEVARNILPEGTYSTLYMTGSARSWIHFLQARLHPGAQKETQLIAQEVKEVFALQFPTCAQALELKDDSK